MPQAFWCLTLKNPLRLAAISVLEWKWWSPGVLLLILINSLMLTMEDPFDDPPSSELGKLLAILSTIFSIFFTVETVVRMVALGLWGHTNGFFHSPWNIMDLIIVVSGILEMAGSSVKVSMLRTLRVMRPLRSFTRIPSLRLLITTIIQAWRPLFSAVLVTMVLTTSLGLVGVATFQGKLRNRCYSIHTGFASPTTTRRCDLGSNGPRMLLQGAFTCPYGEQCLPLRMPLPGEPVASFDDIFEASLSIFRILLLDDWSKIMFDTADCTSISSMGYWHACVCACGACVLHAACINMHLRASVCIMHTLTARCSHDWISLSRSVSRAGSLSLSLALARSDLPSLPPSLSSSRSLFKNRFFLVVVMAGPVSLSLLLSTLPLPQCFPP